MILQEEENCFSQNTLSPSKLQPKALSFSGDASGKTKTVNAEKVTIFFLLPASFTEQQHLCNQS